MDVTRVNIEWDEDGCYLELKGDGGARDTVTFHIHDPEQLYDAVKGGIGPWLRERDEARAEYQRTSNPRAFRAQFMCDPDESGGLDPDFYGPYPEDVSDPKHPDFHSIHADIWDSRAGK